MKVKETEQELISQAHTAVSNCNWVLGECAAKWTSRYARGRTDADFARMIGLSADQVYQRRRVWESFANQREVYPALHWSHFYVAINWNDAKECLGWAEENQATIAEMKAWRRSLHGEDLNEPTVSDSELAEMLVSHVPTEPTAVRDPAGFDERQPAAGDSTPPFSPTSPSETLAGVAREGRDDNYAPFRSGAGSPAPNVKQTDIAVVEKPVPVPEQTLQRITRTLQRISRSLSEETVKALSRLPKADRRELVEAVAEIQQKIARLN